MTAIKQMKERFSLNHSLKYAGLAKTAWYHKPKSRDLGINRDVLQAVQKTGHKRPTIGSRTHGRSTVQGTGASCKPQADAIDISKNGPGSCLEKENMTL